MRSTEGSPIAVCSTPEASRSSGMAWTVAHKAITTAIMLAQPGKCLHCCSSDITPYDDPDMSKEGPIRKRGKGMLRGMSFDLDPGHQVWRSQDRGLVVVSVDGPHMCWRSGRQPSRQHLNGDFACGRLTNRSLS
jgi:hypothetical protein